MRYSQRLMPLATLEFEKQPASTDSQLILRLNGKLSLETVHSFVTQLRPEPAAALVLDMSGVTFLDSAGVGALVQLFVHRKSAGQLLRNSELQAIFKLPSKSGKVRRRRGADVRRGGKPGKRAAAC